jgi:hypothetical protein
VFLNGVDHKTVFLLGAGATRGAVKHVLVNQKRLKPPLNGDFFDVAATFVRAQGIDSIEAKRLNRLTRFFKQELPVKGKPPMETAFSLLYVVKDFHEIYRNGPGRKPLPGESQEVEDFLLLVFHILCAVGDHAPGQNGYDRLVSRLGPKDTLITLNYDTLLDSALWRCGWNPKRGYGLTGDARKIDWIPTNSSHSSILSAVLLLKLHGSLNWFVRGSVADLSVIFESKAVRVSRPRRNELNNHIRQIVPPIYGKFFRHAQWRTLWEKAYKALRDAEMLVIVGCSLVDTDFHLRALISRVSQDRKKSAKPFRRVFLVDHSLKVRRKWMTSIKGSTKKVSSIKGFEQFLRKELRT